ncbi:hypothetical protein [uncultured Jatrophihabitans sp.]|uniref:hypothetical protein n=1 Tax=uncultured Jatrophihabitans sp. TaxID=1610747 RepID=UPI0035CC3CF3
MDAPVVAAWITSGAALVVALYGGVRADVRAGRDRDYERRKEFLIDAQDAALDLRDALAEFGAALKSEVDLAAPGDGTFTMSVPTPVDTNVRAARGALDKALSRVDDAAVVAAAQTWRPKAEQSPIDDKDVEAADEQAAFDRLNELVAAALASRRGRLARRPSAGR